MTSPCASSAARSPEVCLRRERESRSIPRRLGLFLTTTLAVVACGGPTSPSTAACPGPYPGQGTSPYVLPWQIGERYRIRQGNCGSGSHAAGSIVQYAYDVLMPIGTPILAARSGTVLLVEQRFPDGTRVPGEENYINVVQSDGSIAAYVHLTRDGARVSVGDQVDQGRLIGLRGDSGSSSEPHVHFHVRGVPGARQFR